MLVSAIHQHELAIGVHLSPPSWISLPAPIPSHPSWLSQSTGLKLPVTQQIPLPIYFTCGNIYVSMLLLSINLLSIFCFNIFYLLRIRWKNVIQNTLYPLSHIISFDWAFSAFTFNVVTEYMFLLYFVNCFRIIFLGFFVVVVPFFFCSLLLWFDD